MRDASEWVMTSRSRRGVTGSCYAGPKRKTPALALEDVRTLHELDELRAWLETSAANHPRFVWLAGTIDDETRRTCAHIEPLSVELGASMARTAAVIVRFAEAGGDGELVCVTADSGRWHVMRYLRRLHKQ